MLKKIGEVSHVARDKRLIVKLTYVPPLNITVFDYSMRRLGILHDIIGPVSSPYGIVKPTQEVLGSIDSVVGKAVYVREVDLRRGARHGVRR